jgi:uncharacterized membrane-anchored protein
VRITGGVARRLRAERLLRSIGGQPRQGMLGVVIATLPNSTEMVVLYARDGLASGIPEIEFVGWQEAPEFARFRQR